jgi:hypothetical protein
LFFFFVLSHSCSIVVDPFTILLLFSIAILLVKLVMRVQVEPKRGSLSLIQKEAPPPSRFRHKKRCPINSPEHSVRHETTSGQILLRAFAVAACTLLKRRRRRKRKMDDDMKEDTEPHWASNI